MSVLKISRKAASFKNYCLATLREGIEHFHNLSRMAGSIRFCGSLLIQLTHHCRRPAIGHEVAHAYLHFIFETYDFEFFPFIRAVYPASTTSSGGVRVVS